ncbi:MAG: hypothetical protein PHO08_09135 [Methylococcales bacterium]|nr:hypothetical protein [Methylococcales bacterium]MDD5630781.1 hypothetical protein [Methylococcales bacterium]
MERCPCCNARLTEAVFCPRCQADLGSVLGSEQLARHWLNNALQFWLVREPQMAILALTKSVNLKQTPPALVFRDFITRRQGQKALAFLAKKKCMEAEKLLSTLRDLNPDNEFIRQLYGFTEYLLVKDVIEISTRQTIRSLNELKSR